jgi:hypothetical protein
MEQKNDQLKCLSEKMIEYHHDMMKNQQKIMENHENTIKQIMENHEKVIKTIMENHQYMIQHINKN